MIGPKGQDPTSDLEVARRVVEVIAGRQRERADEIARNIFDNLRDEIPEYGNISDDRLVDDVRSVSRAGVVIWLEMLRTGRPAGSEDFEPIREGARRRARQGFDHYALLRAWRIAVRVMWRQLISDPAALEPQVTQVLLETAEAAMTYSDQLSLAVTDAYLIEAGRSARDSERRRSVLMELILSHPEDLNASDVPVELTRTHVVIVAEAHEAALQDLDRIGLELQRRAAAASWTVRSDAVVAIVPIAAGGRAGWIARLGANFGQLGGVRRVGVGGQAANAVQTRQSYIEATEALSYGDALGIEGPVYDFVAMGPYSLLLSQPERAARFIDSTLAPLQGMRAAWLEPTLEAYIARQGRIKETALALQVHPNTVKYRLAQLRGPLRHSVHDPNLSAQLLIALRLRRLLEAAG